MGPTSACRHAGNALDTTASQQVYKQQHHRQTTVETEQRFSTDIIITNVYCANCEIIIMWIVNTYTSNCN